MTDTELLALFRKRDEAAISATEIKYGQTLRHIAYELLGSRQDAEEIVNDVLMTAWNAIPPENPRRLLGYLAAVTRNQAMDRLDARTAQRRGGGHKPAVLDELADCIRSPETVEQEVDRRMLAAAINDFLSDLPEDARAVFVMRYTLAMPVRDIARRRGISQSAVKIMLFRTRKKLKAYLEREGLL